MSPLQFRQFRCKASFGRRYRNSGAEKATNSSANSGLKVDKKQDKETRKYTALREGLTELIAIPVYYGSGKLAECLSNKLAQPKDMPKEIYKQIIEGKAFEEVDLAAQAKNIRKNIFKMRTNLSMLGVFLAALLVIPAVCSATIKPIMKLVQKPKDDKKTLDINTKPELANIDKPTFKSRKIGNYSKLSIYNYPQSNTYGMKVGGIC